MVNAPFADFQCLGSHGDSHFFTILRMRRMVHTIASDLSISPPRADHVTLPFLQMPAMQVHGVHEPRRIALALPCPEQGLDCSERLSFFARLLRHDHQAPELHRGVGHGLGSGGDDAVLKGDNPGQRVLETALCFAGALLFGHQKGYKKLRFRAAS